MLFGRRILDFSQEQFSKANAPMYSTPSSKLILIISLLANRQLRELLQKAQASIFLIVLGIVKLHSFKYQLNGQGLKVSSPISLIVYPTHSYVNFPPLKLKSPFF